VVVFIFVDRLKRSEKSHYTIRSRENDRHQVNEFVYNFKVHRMKQNECRVNFRAKLLNMKLQYELNLACDDAI